MEGPRTAQVPTKPLSLVRGTRHSLVLSECVKIFHPKDPVGQDYKILDMSHTVTSRHITLNDICHPQDLPGQEDTSPRSHLSLAVSLPDDEKNDQQKHVEKGK